MSGYIGNIPVPQATQSREVFTATSGQTTFATVGYPVGFVDVWLNGVKLVAGTDFTATNGSDVVLTVGAATGDTVEVISNSTFEVNSQTFTGGLTVNNDAATVLTVDRATSDGSIVDFKKSGTTVGSIGADGGAIYIGNTAGEQFKFHNGTGGSFYPKTDNNNDLGASGNRFKNLYLSGGVYLGGTGAANLLDDYEEGTWTPILAGQGGGSKTPSGGNYGWYVKAGGYATVGGTINWNGGDASLSGNILITGFPFNSSSENVNLRCSGALSTIASGSLTATSGYTWFSTTLDAGMSSAYIIQNSSSGYSHTPSVANAGAIYGFTITYRTA